MALEGALKDFGLPDILQLIYFQKKSGTLTLIGRTEQVKIIFYEGNVLSAETKKKKKLGQFLLSRKLIEKDVLTAALAEQISHTVQQLFSWKEGIYKFEPQAVVSGNDMATVTLDTQQLLMDGLRVIDEWSQVTGKVTPDTVFRSKTHNDVELNTYEQGILEFIDGENDVSMIISLSGIDHLHASEAFESLTHKGVIEIAVTAPVMTAATPVAPKKFYLRTFDQNKEIFAEGTKGTTAYILKTGSVEISVKIGDNKKVLSIIKPTTVFGEVALLSVDHKRIATATAIEYTEAIEIDSKTFDTYIEQSPQVVSMLLKALVERGKKSTMTASKVPDLFSGVCGILHLMATSNSLELNYRETINTISRILSVDAKETKSKIDLLENYNLIAFEESSGGVCIRINQKDDFLKKAFKLQQAIPNIY